MRKKSRSKPKAMPAPATREGPAKGRHTRTTWSLMVVGLIATFLAYLPAMRGPFEFDDVKSIPENPSIRALWPLSVPMHPPQNTTVAGRPIVNVTLAINQAINDRLEVDQRPDPYGPNKTLGYHVVNLLMHLGCGLLLFGIIRRTMRLAGGDDRADAIALIVAILWLVHPIQTEAVNYLIQRTEVLVSLCYAGTLYAWVRGWDATGRRSKLGWRSVAVAICLLGMGSKEVMITAPLVVLLYDRAFRVSSWKGVFAERNRMAFYGLLVATALWPLAMVVGNARFSTVGFGLGLPWYRYFYSQCWAIAHYLWLVVWPSRLIFDYGQRPILGLAGIPGLILLTSFGIATIVAWARPSRWSWFGFLGATFFLLLAPSSSVVPIITEIAAERRIYLALAPILVLLVLAAEWALVSRSNDAIIRRRQRIFWGLAGIVAVALTVRTYQRSATYGDAELLWRDALEKSPGNTRAYDNLAALMFRSSPPRLAAASSLYRRALDLDSTYVNAWRGLASVAVEEQRFAEARSFLEHALAIQPGYVDAAGQLGRLHFRTGHSDLAIPYLEQYATIYPTDSSLTVLGLALLDVGRLNDAANAFRRALGVNPNAVDPMRLLGAALVEQGSGAEAVIPLERLMASGSATPVDMGLLSLGYAEAGRVDDAVQSARVAVQNAPGRVPVLILAGRSMIVAHRESDAVGYLSEALRLDPRNREAAAYLARARGPKQPR